MKVYARKLYQHDMTHEVSIVQSIVNEFFQVVPGNQDQLVFIGKNSQERFKVTINTPDDPRFGMEFKRLLAVESNDSVSVNDIILIFKHTSNYTLEYIKKSDEKYDVLWGMFENNKRHLVISMDDEQDSENETESVPVDLRKEFEKYLKEERQLVQWERQAREIGDWSQRLYNKGIISKQIYSIYDYDEYVTVKEAIRQSDDYKAYKKDRKDKNPNSGLPSDQGLTNYGEFLLTLDLDELGLNADLQNTGNVIIGAENVLYYGVPGSGKSRYVSDNYEITSENHERVVFHPEYSYSDFVGQILPESDGESIKYPFVPGPFTSILRKAIHHKNRKYYLIIEELNRGNAPAIFGDLFQLLDRNEIGESEYEVTNFDVAKAVYHDKYHKIRLPSNLWIIATMNTSDQNVFTLDTAFQRRWNMQLVRNDITTALHANESIKGSSITWSVFAEIINEKILNTSEQFGGFGDKRLGAYFAKINELERDRFPGKVLKYLWDDAFKMNHGAVFNESIKSFDYLIGEYSKPSGDPLQKVLNDEVYQSMLNKINDASNHEQTETDSTTDESVN